MISRSVQIVIIGCLLALSPLKGQSQDFTDPVVYNDYLVREQSKIIQLSVEYLSLSIQSEDYNSIDRKRLEFISEIGRSMNKVRRMPNFQGTNRLKRQTLNVFNKYIETYETDLIEMMGLKKKYKDSYEALEAYLEAEAKVDEKLRKAIEDLSHAQEAFANKYDLKFTPGDKSELTERISSVNELSKYSRTVFLEYFKVSWEFNELVKLLPEKNGRKLEKQRIRVIETCNKGLANMNTISPYNNETEYMQLTIDLIQYFRMLSRKEFASIAVIFNKDEITGKDAEFVNRVFSDYNANIVGLVYNWNLANQFLWKENIN